MRYELSDYEWTAIKPMLPNKPLARQQEHGEHSAETKPQRPDLL
jgi:transposase